MTKFLEDITRQLVSNHQTDLAEICVVMPNRRAGLYLKKYISEEVKKTVWAPDVFSIEDFLIQISGFQKLDNVALIFEMYEIHKEIEKQNPQEFEQFIKWGQVMLSDFNEIDMSLVDARGLYTYLSEAKAIEKWNPEHIALTLAEREYLDFYHSLYEYYSLLKTKLLADKHAYQGLIYRYVAENITSLSEKCTWKKIYFAGFNALTKAEEKILYFLRDQGKAEIIRDVDAYYLYDEKQEAGDFLRRQLRFEGKNKFGPVGEYFKENEKKIYLHGVPRNAGQAVVAGKILQKWIDDSPEKESSKKGIIKDAAVVLADESLLMPVLNALPQDLDTFNVTMGYPLRLTPPFNLVMLIFRLFENMERFKRMGSLHKGGFYHRDVVSLLQHRMMAGLFDIREEILQIKSSGQVFYSSHEISVVFESGKEKNNEGEEGIHSLIDLIFGNSNPTTDEILGMIEKVFAIFRKAYKPPKVENIDKNAQEEGAGNVDLQLEYLFHVALMIKRLKELNSKYKAITNARTLREIFRQISAGSRIPFSGEPLQETQIMGMLETRNLDFDKFILLSANEGILPVAGSGNSLIPFDIQVEQKIPTYNQKNAVFAYHFYRLLQRASEVRIIYNTEAGELGGGDKSRFIHQLISEMPFYNPNIKIIDIIEKLPLLEKAPEQIIEIEKTDPIYEGLLLKAKKGLAPTSLNQYRKCSLQFYFKNVAGLKENKEVEETLEYRTIGSIVHQVLEDFYLPFVNKNITTHDIAAMHEQLNALLEKAFAMYYKKGQVKYGKNRLIYEVIRNFILSFLKFEKGFLEEHDKQGGSLRIVDLEKEYVSENLAGHLPVPTGSQVKLFGKVDRVDELNGITRIIDYKTGKVDSPGELHISDWDEFLDGNKKEKAFQIMMYAWLYHQEHLDNTKELQGGIISLPKLSNGLMNFGTKDAPRAKANVNIDAEMLENFEQYLLSLLSEIFDRDIPFAQTDNADTCRLCDYKEICGK